MLNVAGLVSIIIFYIVILAIGIWAGRKSSKTDHSDEEVILAGRNIGVFVGMFTMTATWVGGGYINGATEIAYKRGLLWCQSPIGYSLSLILGGYFFAEQMREQGYITMLDPLQQRLGKRVASILYIPALCGEVFFSALTLTALGSTVSVIIDWDKNSSVLVSAAIAVGYTLFGGLYSVAYTDVAQLFCIFVGLWLAVPFAMAHDAVGPLVSADVDWFGDIHTHEIPQYVDVGLLLIFGGIPWQCYFQRVLSSKTARGARLLSYSAAFGCIIVAIPCALLGIVAKATDWSLTTYGQENADGLDPIQRGEALMTLPLVIHHLTPQVVGIFVLGAVTAAVMSSVDSSVLSAASMFARNMYRAIFRTGASENEIRYALKGSILVIGGGAAAMALTVTSVYSLSVLSSDLIYVILFPQLLLVVHFKDLVNTYGSVAAFILGFAIRLASGEPLISLPALIHFPGYDEGTGLQQFPFRTFAMLISLGSMVFVSKVAEWMFRSGYLPWKYEISGSILNPSQQGKQMSEVPMPELEIKNGQSTSKSQHMDTNI